VFTGLVQGVGTVAARDESHLEIAFPPDLWSDSLTEGESVAINGACLTVTHFTESQMSFDVSQETWNRTSLGQLKPDSTVNLERAMRATDRFGGHIVQGHVDGVGKVLSKTDTGEFIVFRFEIPAEGTPFLIDKGSITIDGVSLTVVQPSGTEFDVWVIPHTLANTNLNSRNPGDEVNLEYDVIAKYVQRLVKPFIA
jgi:riboflavin synthase